MPRLGLAIGVIAASAACQRYSPPIRSTVPGAAGQLRGGEIAATGAATLYRSGGPTLAVGVTDWLAAEAGAELSAANGGWALGSLAARFSVDGRERLDDRRGWGPAGDVALTGAIGGGAVGESGRLFLARLAGGGALDAGFSIYAPAILSGTVRGSVQLSGSESGIPMTLWWYAATGPELCFERKPPYRGVRISLYHSLDERRRDTGGSATNYRGVRISLYHSLGIAGLRTARDTLFGPFVSLGTTLFFPSFEPP